MGFLDKKGKLGVPLTTVIPADYAGHEPVVNPIMSTKDDRLRVKKVEKANIADYFELK